VIDLNKIKQRILQGEQIEEIIEEIDWKEFEELITEILKNHDFKVYQNFRFKTRRRYEIDIFGIKGNSILTIDCKQWGRGRYKKSSLKNAVDSQKERTEELKKFLKNNLIIKTQGKKLIPLIITWLEEDLTEYDKTLIVPIWKLNEFLLNMSDYV